MGQPRMIAVAEIGAAHGVKGEVRLKSFTEAPADVAQYGPLVAADGRTFEVVSVRPAAGSSSKEMLIARLKGVDDRNAAEALTGTRLSIPYDRLPPPDDGEYYLADLVGLAAVSPDGAPLGTVVSVQNYGAGDLIEIAPERGETMLVPFTNAAVPEVDIAGGRIVVVPPAADEGERP